MTREIAISAIIEGTGRNAAAAEDFLKLILSPCQCCPRTVESLSRAEIDYAISVLNGRFL